MARRHFPHHCLPCLLPVITTNLHPRTTHSGDVCSRHRWGKLCRVQARLLQRWRHHHFSQERVLPVSRHHKYPHDGCNRPHKLHRCVRSAVQAVSCIWPYHDMC